jgi:hypothetical protein
MLSARFHAKVVNKWNEYIMWIVPCVYSKSGGWLGSIPIHLAMQGFRGLLSFLFNGVSSLGLIHYSWDSQTGPP